MFFSALCIRDGQNSEELVVKNLGEYPGMVAYACNPSTWQEEAGGLQV
jgi:hypothetical protein